MKTSWDKYPDAVELRKQVKYWLFRARAFINFAKNNPPGAGIAGEQSKADFLREAEDSLRQASFKLNAICSKIHFDIIIKK